MKNLVIRFEVFAAANLFLPLHADYISGDDLALEGFEPKMPFETAIVIAKEVASQKVNALIAKEVLREGVYTTVISIAFTDQNLYQNG